MATRKTASSATSTVKSGSATTASYQHSEAQAIIRPEAGTQTRFKKKKPTATWHYDSSLAPELQWDAQNPAREQGEARIAALQTALASMEATLTEVQSQLAAAKPSESAAELNTLVLQARAKLFAMQNGALRAGRESATALKALSKPFLNWAGKAERLSFEVPTLPLFIHERLSTQAILDSVKRYKSSTQLGFDFGGHPDRDLAEQLLKSYEYPNGWFNRMVLGDSLVVMNSMLHYEHMAGQVQMIYVDPPYGVKFGSNFQPFVRKRDVKNNDDADMTREPEMVQAYRDTWSLGLHSYLTYLRDRLLVARDLLTPSGSVFVQISDDNLHHVRELMDEVFGAANFCGLIEFVKTSSASSTLLSSISDYVVWYGKARSCVRYNQLYLAKSTEGEGAEQYTWAEHADGSRKNYSNLKRLAEAPLGSKTFRQDNLTSQRPAAEGDVREFVFDAKVFKPGSGTFKCPSGRLLNRLCRL